MTLAKVLVEEESVICKLISCPVVKVTECVKSENVPAPVAVTVNEVLTPLFLIVKTSVVLVVPT